MGSNQLLGPKKTPKLFVFGDSYADTGNTKSDTEAWAVPYGITFPGKPSGRYCDGLIATDLIAKVLGAESPHLYRTHGKNKTLKKGMNFAFGGSKVVDYSPHSPFPNITAQVNLLVDIVLAGRVQGDITPTDVSLISYAGGDYIYFIDENRPAAGMKALVEEVVDHLHVNMIVLSGLLFKKVAVTSLQPIGCLPTYTSASSFKSCNESQSALVELHNKLLRQVVAKLNEQSRVMKKGQHYFIIDIHHAFMTVLKNKGSKRFKTPMMKSCCEGFCGRSMDGDKLYTLCDDPKSFFFWDEVHPTQEGWKSIYSVLGNPLTESKTKP
ncbi:PREDICTED: GDSL esterase/lipase At5g03600 [Camelina sativa]|uniref:GDSL esterase/lipase At5g03600 n=1 Tax=Camelina sativa TaxID=90675 RepID=A0ABM1RFE3_CAMSA|nr:PREDICTED: GDSL esterase/lipase At5g03600 [Camelina sativa]